MIAIDTNILVYGFDKAYPKKMEVANRIIKEIFSGEKKGAVTNQILAEFAFIVTEKIERPLSREDAKAVIGSIQFSENWRVFNYDDNIIMKALESKGPFWDVLIANTLKANAIEQIITENEKDFKSSGLITINPFI